MPEHEILVNLVVEADTTVDANAFVEYTLNRREAPSRVLSWHIAEDTRPLSHSATADLPSAVYCAPGKQREATEMLYATGLGYGQPEGAFVWLTTLPTEVQTAIRDALNFDLIPQGTAEDCWCTDQPTERETCGTHGDQWRHAAAVLTARTALGLDAAPQASTPDTDAQAIIRRAAFAYLHGEGQMAGNLLADLAVALGEDPDDVEALMPGVAW